MAILPTNLPKNTQAFIDACQKIIGSQNVVINNDEMSPYLIDWRRRYKGQACAILLPHKISDIKRIVQLALQFQIKIVTQGGNTSLCGGATPMNAFDQVVISLKKLNAIRFTDRTNYTICVDAGCTLKEVQDAAQAAGLFFPLSLAAEGTCTIGGNLSTNAGGTNVLNYGNARELCLGLEVVTASGEIWDGLQQLYKNNTGYALKHIFIGAEGTLGIITGAILKLFPKPYFESAIAALPSLHAAVKLLETLRMNSQIRLTAFEIMSNTAIRLVTKQFPEKCPAFILSDSLQNQTPYFALIESTLHLNEDHLSATEIAKTLENHAQNFIEQLNHSSVKPLITQAWIAQNNQQYKSFWQMRESISDAQAAYGLNIKHDISLPISDIPLFVEDTCILLNKKYPGISIINFGHLGDGNLHYNVAAPNDQNHKIFLDNNETGINNIVYQQVAKYKGSFSAEHGIGQLKVSYANQYRPKAATDLMRELKKAWDPNNMFNPGKMIDDL